VSKLRLEIDDSSDIGFVDNCLVPGVISLNEFKEWIYFVIENHDDIPSYFFEILDLNHKFEYNCLRIMGFAPKWEYNDASLDALVGIGFKRGAITTNDNLTREEALRALERNPHIEKKFYEMFPFLKERDGVTDL